MNDETPGVGVIAGAALAAGVAGIAAAVALSAFAKPSHFSTRLEAVSGQVARAEALAAAPGNPDGHVRNAVCPARASRDVDSIRSGLAATAAQAGLASANVSVSVLDAAENATMTPLRVSIVAEGSYDAAMTLLDRLGQGQPEVFIDSFDLKSRTTSVALKLSGKAYCWIAAR